MDIGSLYTALEHMLWVITDFRFSQWSIIDVNSAFGLLHCMSEQFCQRFRVMLPPSSGHRVPSKFHQHHPTTPRYNSKRKVVVLHYGHIEYVTFIEILGSGRIESELISRTEAGMTDCCETAHRTKHSSDLQTREWNTSSLPETILIYKFVSPRTGFAITTLIT
jgi:hypothetical protein